MTTKATTTHAEPAVYVYEAPLRLWHWINALAIVVLYDHYRLCPVWRRRGHGQLAELTFQQLGDSVIWRKPGCAHLAPFVHVVHRLFCDRTCLRGDTGRYHVAAVHHQFHGQWLANF